MSVSGGKRQQKKLTEIYLLFPQGLLTAEVPKPVGEIGLVASALETKSLAEAGQRHSVHLVTVFMISDINVLEM